LSPAEKALLERVSLLVHRQDEMYVPFRAAHYLGVGLSALRNIESALSRCAQAGSVRTILDLPCGHGRVLRFLRERFPDAAITAVDLDRSGLEFCGRAFAVQTAPSSPDFDTLSLQGRFDLIWCGSLVTHLDEAAATSLLRFFQRHLEAGGTCVFTAHGAYSAAALRKGEAGFGLTPQAQQSLLAGFERTGYGFAAYPDQRGYGISMVTPERMRALAGGIGGWNETFMAERGWDNHQDVYAFCRSGA
ncbi:MAG: class I SAM-dependent methyltransferase, partial [Planctomycetota bacterium]|nr:class I SAM-dependent methyltransferase [Planctomycetota bacterium]